MQAKLYSVDLLIFDLDGTLVDTSKDIVNAVNYALEHIGHKPLPAIKIMSFIGNGIMDLLQSVLASDDEMLLSEGLKYFQEHYRRHLYDHSRLYPGMDKVLQSYHQAKKGVLSNKSQEFTELLLKKMGLYRQFDFIIGGQSGFKYKPDSESIVYLLKQFDTQPKKAVIIGDSINDIIAGKSAAILTCAVTYGYYKKQTLLSLNPEIVVDYPLQLCEILVTNNNDRRIGTC